MDPVHNALRGRVKSQTTHGGETSSKNSIVDEVMSRSSQVNIAEGSDSRVPAGTRKHGTYVCMHARTHDCACTHAQNARMHARTHVCMHKRTHAHTYARTHAVQCTHMCVHNILHALHTQWFTVPKELQSAKVYRTRRLQM